MEKEKEKILVVENSLKLRMFLKEFLVQKGYDVVVAKNRIEGYQKFKNGNYNLCLLEVIPPYKDGFKLANDIRKRNTNVPIIFLASSPIKAYVLEKYKVNSDGFFVKPFDSSDFLSKIVSTIERSAKDVEFYSRKTEFSIGRFNLNTRLRYLSFNGGEPSKLSPKESELLRLLALHENDLMPRTLALNKIWRDDNYFTSRSMDVYITKLRKYLESDKDIEITNIRGEGFRLIVNK